MPTGEAETRIFLDLHYVSREGLDSDDGRKVFLPVPIAEVDQRRESGWSVYELESIAFEAIPEEFPEERKTAGALLARLADFEQPILLTAHGPEEGDYYIEVTNQNIRLADRHEG